MLLKILDIQSSTLIMRLLRYITKIKIFLTEKTQTPRLEISKDGESEDGESDHVDIDMIIKVLAENTDKAKNMLKDIIQNFEFTLHKNENTHNSLDTAIITAPSMMTDKTKNKLKTIAGRVLFPTNEN